MKIAMLVLAILIYAAVMFVLLRVIGINRLELEDDRAQDS